MELWEVDYLQPYEQIECNTCFRMLDPECYVKKSKGQCTECRNTHLNWPTGIKHCGLCNKDKPFISFHRDNYLPDGFRTQCRRCVKLRNQRSEEHKKALAERTRLWNIANGYSADNPDRPRKSTEIKRKGKPGSEKRRNLRYDPLTDLRPDFINHLEKVSIWLVDAMCSVVVFSHSTRKRANNVYPIYYRGPILSISNDPCIPFQYPRKLGIDNPIRLY